MALPYWRMDCIYAPADPMARHCNKENDGKKSDRKAEIRGKRTVNKGNFGCAENCRFYKRKEA